MMSVIFYNDRLGLPMGWCQWTTYRKPPTASLMVTWPMTYLTTKYLRLNISETVQDTGLVSMGHK